MSNKKKLQADIEPQKSAETSPKNITEQAAEATSTIKYSGSVTVKYVDRKTGKVKRVQQHNAGMPGLFSFICNCLAANLEYRDKYRPQKLMLRDGNENDLLSQPATFYSTPILFDSIENKKGAKKCDSIQYTFNVTPGLFKQLSGKVKEMVLLNNATNEGEPSVCAIIDGDWDIQPGTNMLIYWTLMFQDGNPQNEEEIATDNNP